MSAVNIGSYAWEAFDRFRHEIICLHAVPAPLERMPIAQALSDVGLSGIGVDALKDHLVEALNRAVTELPDGTKYKDMAQ